MTRKQIPKFQPMPISLEQQDARFVLGIFWPGGNPKRSDEENIKREQKAVEALCRKYPDVAREEICRRVSFILDMEEAEYLIAIRFCQEILMHIQIIDANLANVDKLSEDVPKTKRLI